MLVLFLLFLWFLYLHLLPTGWFLVEHVSHQITINQNAHQLRPIPLLTSLFMMFPFKFSLVGVCRCKVQGILHWHGIYSRLCRIQVLSPVGIFYLRDWDVHRQRIWELWHLRQGFRLVPPRGYRILFQTQQRMHRIGAFAVLLYCVCPTIFLLNQLWLWEHSQGIS